MRATAAAMARTNNGSEESAAIRERMARRGLPLRGLCLGRIGRAPRTTWYAGECKRHSTSFSSAPGMAVFVCDFGRARLGLLVVEGLERACTFWEGFLRRTSSAYRTTLLQPAAMACRRAEAWRTCGYVARSAGRQRRPKRQRVGGM
jgi:hypothetical protein